MCPRPRYRFPSVFLRMRKSERKIIVQTFGSPIYVSDTALQWCVDVVSLLRVAVAFLPTTSRDESFRKPHTTSHIPHFQKTLHHTTSHIFPTFMWYHINVVPTCGEIPHHMWYCLISNNYNTNLRHDSDATAKKSLLCLQ